MSENEKKKLLEIKDLKIYYPIKGKRDAEGKPAYVKAVDGVTFDVYENETFGLVGESGCGKSTTGRTVVRLNKPTAGSVTFEGHDLFAKMNRQQNMDLTQKIQIIYQDPYSSLDPRFTVGRCIEEPLIVHHMGNKEERRARVLQLMHDVGLREEEIAEPFNAYFGENPPAGVIVEAPPRQNTPFGPKLEIELALFVATGENPQITRRDVVPGMSRVVEYNGIAWFTGHSARPEFKTLATQSEAVMKRYAELFEQFGYKKENILMEYGYVRDIEQVNDYLGARKVFIDPENPPAGVVVQAKPSGDENQLEVQFIVNLD